MNFIILKLFITFVYHFRVIKYLDESVSLLSQIGIWKIH